jgi:hypothetical protein
MNPKKYPKLSAIRGLLSTNSQQRHALVRPATKSVERGREHCLFDTQNRSNDKPIESIRYARNAKGMLSHRDPEILRRYILDARTKEEQAQRQNELFQSASVGLACIPSGHQFDLQNARALRGLDAHATNGAGESFKSLGVANCGVFGCPVVVTFRNPKQIFRRLPLDHQTQAHVAQAIEQSLSMSSSTPFAFARVESMICVTDLNCITPLQIQSAVSNESRRMTGDFKRVAFDIPETMKSTRFDAFRKHQGGWSLQMPQLHEVWTDVGPNQSVSFLIIGYFGWDCYLPFPVFVDYPNGGAQRLRTILEGYLAQDGCSNHGELGFQAATDRVEVEVGRLTWMHEALTQAQAMQFAVMKRRAQKVQGSFSLRREQRGNVQHWAASIAPAQMELRVAAVRENSAVATNVTGGRLNDQKACVVEHIYDAFWRPESHISEIEKLVLAEQHESASEPVHASITVVGEVPPRGDLH